MVEADMVEADMVEADMVEADTGEADMVEADTGEAAMGEDILEGLMAVAMYSLASAIGLGITHPITHLTTHLTTHPTTIRRPSQYLPRRQCTSSGRTNRQRRNPPIGIIAPIPKATIPM
jgi:hypothetical protein